MRKKKKIFFIILSSFIVCGILVGIFSSYKDIKDKETKCKKLYNRAQKALKEDKLENAVYCLKVLTNNYKRCSITPLAYYQLAKIYEFKLINLHKAKEYYTYAAHYKTNPKIDEINWKLKIYNTKDHFYKNVIKDYPSVDNLNFLSLLINYKSKLNNAKKDISYLIAGFKEKNKKWIGLNKLNFLLAKIDKYQNNLSSAEKKFKKLNDYLELADVYYRMGKYEEALSYLDKVKEPINIVFYGKAESYFKLNKYEIAITYYEKILNKEFTQWLPVYKNNEKINYPISDYFSGYTPHIRLANCYINTQKYTEAIDILDNYIENLPKEGLHFYHWQRNLALILSGICYERKNNLKLALANYNKVNEDFLDPDETKFHSYLRRANIYAFLKKYDKAINYYERISGKFYYIEALYRIGRIYEAQGKEVNSDYYKNILDKIEKYTSRTLSLQPEIIVYYYYIKKSQMNYLDFYQTQLDKIEESIAEQYGDKIIDKIKGEEYQLVVADIYYYQNKLNKLQEYLEKIIMDDKIRNIISTYSIKPNSLEELRKKIRMKQKMNNLEKKKNKTVNDYLQLIELYQQFGYIDLAYNNYKKLKELDDTITKEDYFKKFNDIINKLESIKQKIYNYLLSVYQLDFLTTDNSSSINLLKKEVINYKRDLLIIIFNILFSTQEEIITKKYLEKELGINIDNETFKIIKQNFIPFLPPDDEKKEKQKILLKDLIRFYSALNQIEEAIDIYNTSGMQPNIIFQMQLDFLEELNVSLYRENE